MCMYNKTMYKQQSFSSNFLYWKNIKCIVLTLIIFIIQPIKAEFFLSTLTINDNMQSFTVPYNKTLSGTQLSFAYFIQCGTITQTTLKLTHYQNQTSILFDRFDIKFSLDGISTMIVGDFLTVKLLVSSYDPTLFTLQMVSTSSGQNVSIALPCLYDPSSVIKSLQPKVFPTILPMTQTLTLNQTHLIIQPTLSPTGITSITFSIMIITRQYQSSNVGLLFDKLQLGNLGWIILFNNDVFFDPNITNMLVGITGYNKAGTPILNVQDQVDYQFSFPLYPDQRSVYIFYDLQFTNPSTFTTSSFIFSETFTGCPGGGFLSYTSLYYDSPLSCQTCDSTCLTCTSTNYSLTVTDETCCLTCSSYKYFEVVDTQLQTGECICYPGLSINATNQQCIPCSQSCLGFTVSFMRSSTQSLFLLTFSSITTQSVPMEDNLRIYVNNNFTANISYTVNQIKTNFYSIVVDSNGLKPCETQCQVNFTFIKPWLILKQNTNESMTENTQSLPIENYYNVGDKIPDQINQAFALSGMLVAAATGGGLSSLLKMLFQLQQMIEFHKYLNMELPLIFKQFIESLSAFKFLDITTLIPFNIDSLLQSYSTDQFDTQGPIKAVYYEHGANFYKNIIPILLSFGIVITVNSFLFFITRLIPLGIFWRLSQKLKVRAIITFSDLLETIILPTVVFANFQLFITYYRLDIIWIYGLTTFLMFCILAIPFVIVAYVFMNRHRQQTKQVYEDLMQDCNLKKNATYMFYLLTFYRKVMFGMALFDMIPGYIQGYAVLSINVTYLSMMVYIVVKKIFHSKLKMFTKTLNTLCVIGIQAIMIYYNSETLPLSLMLDLGASCVYLAIISTVVGVLEAFIKIFEVIFQNVKNSKEQSKVTDKKPSQEKLSKSKSKNLQKQFTTPIYCGLGERSIQKITPMNSKDSIQTIDVQQNDKRSLWNRPKKKLNFLSNIMSKQKKSNNSSNSTNSQSISYDKNNQQQSFAKMNNPNQNSIDFYSIDSNDQFGYGRKNNNEQITKSKRRYKTKTVQALNSSQKLGNIVKRFNSIQQKNLSNNYNNTIQQDKNQDYFEYPIQKRVSRRVKGDKQQSNQLHISSSVKKSQHKNL